MSTAETYLSGQVVLVGMAGSAVALRRRCRSEEFLTWSSIRIANGSRNCAKRTLPQSPETPHMPDVLIQAHIARAGMLVIATPDTVSVRRMAEIARTLNPAIEIAVRTHSEEEARLLTQENVGMVFFGEHELAFAMTRHVLARRGMQLPGAMTDRDRAIASP